MEKRYHDGKWFFDEVRNAWCYLKPGYYEIGVVPTLDDFLHQISAPEVRMLLVKLDEAGWIKPRLDERLRTEDLKITHRLLDIIERKSI